MLPPCSSMHLVKFCVAAWQLLPHSCCCCWACAWTGCWGAGSAEEPPPKKPPMAWPTEEPMATPLEGRVSGGFSLRSRRARRARGLPGALSPQHAEVGALKLVPPAVSCGKPAPDRNLSLARAPSANGVDLRSRAGHLPEQTRSLALLHRRRHLLLRRRGHGRRRALLGLRRGGRGGGARGRAADGALASHREGLCLVRLAVVLGGGGRC